MYVVEIVEFRVGPEFVCRKVFPFQRHLGMCGVLFDGHCEGETDG